MSRFMVIGAIAAVLFTGGMGVGVGYVLKARIAETGCARSCGGLGHAKRISLSSIDLDDAVEADID